MELAVGLGGIAVAGIPGIGITAWQGFQGGLAIGTLLFGGQGRQTSRINDLRVTASLKGAGIPRIYGRQRVAGNILWASGLTIRQESQGGKGGGGSISGEYASTDLALAVCDWPGVTGKTVSIRRIWANEEVIYSHRPESPHSESSPVYSSGVNSANVRIYSGDPSQTADAAIVADKGADAPAYRRTCYVVLQDFDLKPYGNSIPNFTFEVDTGSWTLEEVLDDLCGLAGLEAGDCDWSALSDLTVPGATLIGRTAPAELMQNLQKCFFFDAAEFDWKIQGVKRGTGSAAVIDASHAGFMDIGASEDAAPYVLRILPERETPGHIDVQYFEEAEDYAQAIQEARRRNRPSAGTETVATDLVLTADYASRAGQARLASLWTGRSSCLIRLPWRYLSLAPGDKVSFILDGVSRTYRIETLASRLVGPVEAVLRRHENSDYSQVSVGQKGGGGGSVVSTVSAPYWFVRDVNAPWDEFADQLYLSAVAARDGAAWPPLSGSIYVQDGILGSTGVRKEITHAVAGQSALGVTVAGSAGVLAAGGIRRKDIASTVDVELYNGTLESSTLDGIINNNDNLAMIGSEVVNFAGVSEVSPGVFRLSTFLRGRRGTEEFRSGHASGEPFVLLSGYLPAPFAFSPYELGRSLSFRMLDDFNAYSAGLPSYGSAITAAGRSALPYSPVHLAAVRAGDNDVAVSWCRRARKGAAWLNGGGVALDEPAERYTVQYLHPSTEAVLRQRTVTAESDEYTAAEQASDLGAAGAFKVRVAQETDRLQLVRGPWSKTLSVA